jgi:hypothetical protein
VLDQRLQVLRRQEPGRMQATGQVVVIGEQIGLGAGHLGHCLHARLSREPTAAAHRQKIDFDAQAVLGLFTLDRRESCALRSRYRPYPQSWKFSAEHLEVRLGFATANGYDK